jgi:hypothetical protein
LFRTEKQKKFFGDLSILEKTPIQQNYKVSDNKKLILWCWMDYGAWSVDGMRDSIGIDGGRNEFLSEIWKIEEVLLSKLV